MDKIKEIISKKPQLFVIVSLVYLFLTGLVKWKLTPAASSLWYLFGGVTGIYFLDAAEAFFHLTPSPFRSVIFQALFVVVSLFVVSSSGSLFASGLVLILYLTLILIAVGELRMVGNLDSWYQMVAGKVT